MRVVSSTRTTHTATNTYGPSTPRRNASARGSRKTDLSCCIPHFAEFVVVALEPAAYPFDALGKQRRIVFAACLSAEANGVSERLGEALSRFHAVRKLGQAVIGLFGAVAMDLIERVSHVRRHHLDEVAIAIHSRLWRALVEHVADFVRERAAQLGDWIGRAHG